MERIDEIINLIDSHEKKETKNVFLKYIRMWPWFLLFSIVGLAVGYLIFKNSPNEYTVSSRILIKNQDNDLNSMLNFNQPNNVNRVQKINIENQIGILQSYTLYNKALSNLGWEYSWYQKKLLFNKDLYNNPPFELVMPPNAINAQDVFIEIEPLNDQEYKLKAKGVTNQNGYNQEFDVEQKVKFGEPFVNDVFDFTIRPNKSTDLESKYFLRFNSLHALTSQYLKRTSIAMEDINSDLILITLEGNNPKKDADFINELNHVFIQFGVENENRSSEKSVQFIDDQLSRIKKSLDSSEEEFSNYRQNNQVMNLGEEAQLIYKKLEEIENEQYLTKLQLDFYRDLQSNVDDSKVIKEMMNPSVVGITDPNLTATLRRLAELYSRREELAFSVQAKNPKLVMIDKDIKITRDGLADAVQSQLQVTQSKMQSLNRRFNEVQARLRKLPETEKQVVNLQRDFDLNNELYTYMQQKKAEAAIAKASIAPQVQVIDPAIEDAAQQVGPSLVMNAGAGLAGGFILTFVAITLLGFFNTKIESREEIEKASTLPVLEGIIQHKYKVKLPVVHHPRSGITESFRGLKSNVHALLDQPGSKVISINSLIPGEGKSFISSNFAAVLAKTNTKVLLIGADLHKPTLHNILHVKHNIGMSNYLSGEKNIDDIIVHTSIPNLHFIPSGPIPKNPSELIDNVRFEVLIERVRKMYDYVIIDNAPILLVPDAILTSRFSDVSLFILRINYSHKEQIRQIGKLVDFNKIKKAAVLINDARNRGYGYGNKYWKKGYGEYKQKMSIA